MGAIASGVWNGYSLGLKLGVFGLVCIVGGGWFLYSDISHSMGGVNVPAVLIDRVSECKAEFQPKGESRRKEVMPCEAAYAFQKAVGSSKVRVEKKTLAVMRFTLPDGTPYQAKVSERTMRTAELPIGAQMRVVYDPKKPGDVRPQLSLGSMQSYLALLGLGALGLLVMLVGPILRFIGSLKKPPRAAGDAPAASWEELAAQAIAQQQQARTVAAPRQTAEREVRPRAGVVGARRQFGVRT